MPGLSSRPKKLQDAQCVPSVTTDSPEEATSSARKTHGTRPASRSINVSRERRKQEIEQLRGLVFELQSELKRLQARRDELLRPHFASDTGEFKTIAPVWERLAKHQFQARKKAELQTARLKNLLATQTLAAEELMSLIKRAKHVQQDAFVLPLAQSLSVDSTTIPEQLARLPILCAQWFVAFSWHAQVQKGPMGFFDSKLVSDDGNELVLDIYVNQVFPFPVGQVESAIWWILQAGCVEDHYVLTRTCKASDDSIIANFTAATDTNGQRGALKGTFVSRRFRNEQGHLLIASNVSASSTTTAVGETNFLMNEDCWIRILDSRELPPTDSASESTPTLTVLQHVRRSRFRCINTDEQAGNSKIEAVLDLHRTMIEEELRAGQLNIESMIMAASGAM